MICAFLHRRFCRGVSVARRQFLPLSRGLHCQLLVASVRRFTGTPACGWAWAVASSRSSTGTEFGRRGSSSGLARISSPTTVIAVRGLVTSARSPALVQNSATLIDVKGQDEVALALMW